MKHYPSIPKKFPSDLRIIAFEKLDGSNIRAEWSSTKGFTKFGSRKRLIGPDSLLGESVELVHAQHKEINEVMTRNGYKNALFYFEFLGDSSFAGQHIQEPHRCVLIDVEIPNKGFIKPDRFVEMFSDLETVQIPKVVFKGEVTEEVEKRLRSASEGEGVVCKASTETYHNAMFKIKTDTWIAKVHSVYSDPKIISELL